MQIVVDLLYPQSGNCAGIGISRHHRRRRKYFVKIFDNQCRLDDYLAVVDQRGHHVVGIEPHIVRSMLIAFAQIEQLAVVIEAFLRKDQTHLDRADRSRAVIEEQHYFFVAPSAISLWSGMTSSVSSFASDSKARWYMTSCSIPFLKGWIS